MKALLFIFLCITVVWGLDSRWKLMWKDEFDGTSLNSPWAARGYRRYKNGNYFRQDYATVTNGTLIIKSDRKAGEPYVFESGYVDTAGSAYFTFGRFEVRAKLPAGQGMWPGHWMLSETKCWPYGMEIDILELPYGNTYEPTSVHAAIHFSERCGLDRGNGTSYKVPSNFHDSYHTFAVEWFPGNLTFFLDDVVIHRVSNKTFFGGKPWPNMDESPHFFILDSFIGGWSPAPGLSEPFPKYHYIDSVKAYGWQPCVQGCGDHGVCNQTTGTCTCDSDYMGTYCEYTVAKNYSTNFVAPTSEELLVDTTVIKNGLYLTINDTVCTSTSKAADCKNFTSAQWQKMEGFGSGRFTFNFITPNISGYGLVVEANGGDFSAQNFKLVFSGAELNRFAFQGTSNSAGFFQHIYPGFNPSLAFHTYAVEYVQGKSVTLFIDGVQKHTVTNAAWVTSCHLYPRINYRNDPAWYGPLTGNFKPSTLIVNSFSFTPAPAVKVPRLGSGLTGNYYAKMDFTQLVGTQVDPKIDFNWFALSPPSPAGMPSDLFSVRWTGKIVALNSFVHTFYVKSDDGCNLYVNGNKIISNWVPQSVKEVNGTAPMLAGVKYDITLEYMEQGGNSLVSLSWSSFFISKQIIPTSQLYPF